MPLRTGVSTFLTEMAARSSAATKIVLVMDNLSTHSCEILKQHMGEELATKLADRFEIHYTPVHAHQAQIAIGMFSSQCLGDGCVGDVNSLRGTPPSGTNRQIGACRLSTGALPRVRPAKAWATYIDPIRKNFPAGVLGLALMS
jgi:hypothetical protein